MLSAFHHAQQLKYRGSPVLEESLEKLKENDYKTLLKSKAKFLRPPLTWAKIAEKAVDLIAKALLWGGADRALDAADDARALADRLRDRDHVSARVTAVLRRRIGQVADVARCLEAADAVRNGSFDHDTLSELAALRVRWHALRREFSMDAESDWVLELVQAATGRVLASNAGSGAKALATRVVSAWVPDTRRDSPSPSDTPTWTDSDDDLSIL